MKAVRKTAPAPFAQQGPRTEGTPAVAGVICESLEPRLLLAAAAWGLPYADLGQTSFFAQGSTHALRNTPFTTLCSTSFGDSILRTGDIDGDGKQELVTGDGNDVVIYSSTASFIRTLYNVGNLDLLADVTGDGIPQIIVSDVTSDNVARIRAFGSQGNVVRTFTKQGSITEPPDINAVAVADINGDGVLELVADWQTSGSSPRGIIIFNAATGAEIATYDIGPSPGERVSIGDITGDGKMEILLGGNATNAGVTGGDGSGDSGSYTWALDSSGGLIWRRGPFTASWYAYDNTSVMADVDGNGIQEAVGTLRAQESEDFQATWGQVAILDGVTGATWEGYRRYFDSAVSVVGVADLNPGGNKEILLLAEDRSTSHFTLLAVDSAAGFPVWKSIDLGDYRPTSIVCNDINGDGKIEVLVGTGNGGDLLVLRNDLASLWQWGDHLRSIDQVIVSDMNDDGDNEIIVSTGIGYGTPRVQVLAGQPVLPDAPVNDDCADAIPLSGMQAQATGSNVGATQEPFETNVYNYWSPASAGHSVWWTWTAPVSGTVTVDTIGSSFDTQLMITMETEYSGVYSLCSDDWGGNLTSRVQYDVTAGQTVLIGVDGSKASTTDVMGEIVLHISEVEKVSQTVGTGQNPEIISGQAVHATANNAQGGGFEYWWGWVAPDSGTVTVDTFGSDFDTVLQVVYDQGSTWGCIVTNDDWNGLQSLVQFDAVAGGYYRIGVIGAYSYPQYESGTIKLNLATDNVLALSNTIVAENQPAGTVIGTISAPDLGDGLTFNVVGLDGAAGDNTFCIVGDQLQTLGVLDYEAASSLSVVVSASGPNGLYVEKAFTINLTDVNEVPTDILLSGMGVAEHLPVGTAVGTLTAGDPDINDQATFTLVSGEGSDDNGAFQIVGSQLQALAPFNYEMKDSYTIRVHVVDQGGLSFERSLAINVVDVNEQPWIDNLAAGPLAENSPNGTVIGSMTAGDADIGQTLTYTITAGNVGGAFAIDPVTGQITIAESLAVDFETTPQFNLTVEADDNGSPALANVATVTIDLSNVNEPPTGLGLSSTEVRENLPAGAVVGDLSTADPDAGNVFTYTLVAGQGDTDNDQFTIDDHLLKTTATFIYDAKNSYSIRLRTVDQDGLATEESFVISVTRRMENLNAKGVLQYTDLDGTTVTVSLRGPGTGMVYFAHDGWCDATSIILSGTTDKSSLTIKTKGLGNGTSLGGVDTNGFPLSSIVALTTDLTGPVAIGTSAYPKAAVTLTFDQIKDASITSGMPVKSLTAIEWLDDDGTPDILTAPVVGTITIKGRKANAKAGIPALRGDFQADLDLGGAGSVVKSLGSLSVAGVMDGSTVTVKGADAKGLSIGTFKAGYVDAVTIDAGGGVSSVSTSQWQSGGIEAQWVGSIKTKANSLLGGVGNFGADLTLAGAPVVLKKSTLGSVSIAGDLQANWDLQAGAVGTLAISGTVRKSVLRSAGDIKNIAIGASEGSDFGAGVSFNLLQSDGHVVVGDAANVPTGTIKTFAVKGWKIPTGQSIPRFFIDSNISAKIGKLNLLNWDDQGGLFAPAGSVKSVVYKDTTDKTRNWIYPVPPLQLSSGPDNFVNVI